MSPRPTPAEIDRAFDTNDIPSIARIVDNGFASVRYTAKRLSMNIDDLADLLRPHGCDIDL